MTELDTETEIKTDTEKVRERAGNQRRRRSRMLWVLLVIVLICLGAVGFQQYQIQQLQMTLSELKRTGEEANQDLDKLARTSFIMERSVKVLTKKVDEGLGPESSGEGGDAVKPAEVAALKKQASQLQVEMTALKDWKKRFEEAQAQEDLQRLMNRR